MQAAGLAPPTTRYQVAQVAVVLAATLGAAGRVAATMELLEQTDCSVAGRLVAVAMVEALRNPALVVAVVS